MDLIKSALKKPLHFVGLDITRRQPSSDPPPPPVKENPYEVLYESRRFKDPSVACAFECELDRCTTRWRFGYGPNSWHPFVATLREYKEGRASRYEGSILERYHSQWQPSSAGEALFGPDADYSSLTGLPPIGASLPWSRRSPEERAAITRAFAVKDNEKTGHPGLGIEEGYKYFGPVSPRKGQIEYERLCNVFESIQATGYRRDSGWDGDIGGFLLRKDEDYRFVVSFGHHRLAAVAALEYESIPVKIIHPVVVNRQDAPHWPQVKQGVWTEDEAIRYFDSLFDFDSYSWAQKRGLLGETSSLEMQAAT